MTREEYRAAVARRMDLAIRSRRTALSAVNEILTLFDIELVCADIAIAMAEEMRTKSAGMAEKLWPEADELIDAIAALPLPGETTP